MANTNFTERKAMEEILTLSGASKELTEWAQKKLKQIDERKENRKTSEKALEKAAKATELREVIKELLTDKYQSVAEIRIKLATEKGLDGSPSAVSTRLKELCKEGFAEEIDGRYDGRACKVYRKI